MLHEAIQFQMRAPLPEGRVIIVSQCIGMGMCEGLTSEGDLRG